MNVIPGMTSVDKRVSLVTNRSVFAAAAQASWMAAAGRILRLLRISPYFFCSGSAGNGEGVSPLREWSERRKKQRKHYTPEEKVAILRRHLLEQVPISELCDKHGLQPTIFYRWQKEFFENGAAAFQPKARLNHSAEQERGAYSEVGGGQATTANSSPVCRVKKPRR